MLDMTKLVGWSYFLNLFDVLPVTSFNYGGNVINGSLFSS